MRTADQLRCDDLSCADVVPERYSVPSVELDVDRVRIVLISEAAPAREADGTSPSRR